MSRIRLINGPDNGKVIYAEPIMIRGVIMDGQVYVSAHRKVYGVEEYFHVGVLNEIQD